MLKAIHGYTLINPRITSDNKFKATVYDIYDYTELRREEHPDLSPKTIFVNNLAYFLQEAGIIQNYAIWVEIEIDLN